MTSEARAVLEGRLHDFYDPPEYTAWLDAFEAEIRDSTLRGLDEALRSIRPSTKLQLHEDIARDFRQAMTSAESDGEEYAVAYAARMVAKSIGVTDVERFFEASAVTRWARGRQSDLRIPERGTK